MQFLSPSVPNRKGKGMAADLKYIELCASQIASLQKMIKLL
jgi:hypothetical protein